MNIIRYTLIIYLIICLLIILLVREVRGQWKDNLMDLIHLITLTKANSFKYGLKFIKETSIIYKSSGRITIFFKKTLLILIWVIGYCAVFIATPFVIPRMKKDYNNRIIEEKEKDEL